MNDFMNNLNKNSLSFNDKQFIKKENDRIARQNRMYNNRLVPTQSLVKQQFSNLSNTPGVCLVSDLKPPKIVYTDFLGIISNMDDHELYVMKNIKKLCLKSLDNTFDISQLFEGSKIAKMTVDDILKNFVNKYKILTLETHTNTSIKMYSVLSSELLVDKYNLFIKKRRQERQGKFFNNLFWKIIIPIISTVLIYLVMQKLFPPDISTS